MENFEKTSEPKIVVCLICTSKLAKSSIKSHLKTKKHLNAVSKKSDRPFKCEKCLKSFRCKDNLNLHGQLSTWWWCNWRIWLTKLQWNVQMQSL